MKKLALAVCFVLAGIAGTQAQEKVLFRYNPTVGESLKYNVDMNMDVAGEQSVLMDMRMVMTQTIDGKSENDNFLVKGKVASIKTDMNVGMMMLSYDSENPDDSDPMTAQLAQQFQPILDADLSVETDDRGKVVQFSGADNLQGVADLKSLFNSVEFPEQEVQVGDTWNMDVENDQLGIELKYILTYVGLQDGLHRVDIATDPNTSAVQGAEISAEGFNLYQPATFSLEKSELTSKVDAGGTSITTTAILEKL